MEYWNISSKDKGASVLFQGIDITFCLISYRLGDILIVSSYFFSIANKAAMNICVQVLV